MTAIHPAKLKQESADLSKNYYQPDTFIREFHRLLERYADRTHRTGQAGEPTSILPSYNVPPPVMRQIFRDLKTIAQNNREESLLLCDKLWSQAHFELRTLAAFLLGQIPIDPPEPITRRLTAWTDETLDERMVNVLLNYGLERMRNESQGQIYTLAENWLTTANKNKYQLGIRVLVPLIDHPTAEDIPMIFRLTTPLIRQADIEVRPDVLILWRRLAQSIPQETAYHLQQNLKAPDNPDTGWYVRRLIKHFPAGMQKSLRDTLIETNGS
jgi:hypothetical protein